MSRRTLISALVIGLLSLMTLAGLVLAVLVSVGDGARIALGGRIAVVEVNGIIADDASFVRDVRRLRRDRTVRGWVVAINSPGGVVAPAQSMYQELRRLREDDGVPVVASIGSVGASGGYYVALGADSIMALPGSITGSIGVLLQYANVSELMDRIGVSMELIKAGERKDVGSPFRPLDAEGRAVLTEMLEDVHLQFIEVVARERRLEMDDARRLADGAVFSGRQAQGRGLVDRLGNREEAISLAGRMAGIGPTPRIVRPPRDRGPWLLELLLGQGTVRSIRQAAAPLAEVGPVLKYIVH